MPKNQHHVVRTDISELKSQIEKKIGRVKTETYLKHLSKFLSLKIRKADFDKLIIVTVKRENLSLHNALLRGIIKNVYLSKIKNGIEKKKQLNRGVVSSSGTRQQWSMEDGEEVDKLIQCWRSRPIEAPFGVNLRDVIKKQHHIIGTCYCSGELPDSISLKKKLEDDLEEGLEVSLGFANWLNGGLDVFLKRMIKSCLELAASRRVQVCSSSNGSSAASLLDFQVAMELNPQILGEDWPSMLEKIATRFTQAINPITR